MRKANDDDIFMNSLWLSQYLTDMEVPIIKNSMIRWIKTTWYKKNVEICFENNDLTL